jgi:hypothetical protein
VRHQRAGFGNFAARPLYRTLFQPSEGDERRLREARTWYPDLRLLSLPQGVFNPTQRVALQSSNLPTSCWTLIGYLALRTEAVRTGIALQGDGEPACDLKSKCPWGRECPWGRFGPTWKVGLADARPMVGNAAVRRAIQAHLRQDPGMSMRLPRRATSNHEAFRH